jgi:hypothetical protein
MSKLIITAEPAHIWQQLMTQALPLHSLQVPPRKRSHAGEDAKVAVSIIHHEQHHQCAQLAGGTARHITIAGFTNRNQGPSPGCPRMQPGDKPARTRGEMTARTQRNSTTTPRCAAAPYCSVFNCSCLKPFFVTPTSDSDCTLHDCSKKPDARCV